jgi:hypothetical protein
MNAHYADSELPYYLPVHLNMKARRRAPKNAVAHANGLLSIPRCCRTGLASAGDGHQSPFRLDLILPFFFRICGAKSTAIAHCILSPRCEPTSFRYRPHVSSFLQ